MITPQKLLQDLSDKSLASGQSIEEWLYYLRDLRLELADKISSAERDLENEKKV